MPAATAIPYQRPSRWIHYSIQAVAPALVEARAAVLSLRTIPYQRAWVEALQRIEFKREIAGTSRIEGADFTERELDLAIRGRMTDLQTRSQRQAAAAADAYRWIATLPDDRAIDGDLIRSIHARMVQGCDDDHCRPGAVRGRDENVTFGMPRHRGASGGAECEGAFDAFTQAVQGEFKDHDLLVQALAAHYHLAAMHPFEDGNGRTARALEALILQRGGLRDACFIAISNYYYDEKAAYLAALASVREQGGDLTPFLVFGLTGIALQARRLLDEITRSVQKALFRNMMFDLFNRLTSPRKRVMQNRQIVILKHLLAEDEVTSIDELAERTASSYASLKNPMKAFIRDVIGLQHLKAVQLRKTDDRGWTIQLRLEWPTEITETEFFQRIKTLPRGKTYTLLQDVPVR